MVFVKCSCSLCFFFLFVCVTFSVWFDRMHCVHITIPTKIVRGKQIAFGQEYNHMMIKNELMHCANVHTIRLTTHRVKGEYHWMLHEWHEKKNQFMFFCLSNFHRLYWMLVLVLLLLLLCYLLIFIFGGKIASPFRYADKTIQLDLLEQRINNYNSNTKQYGQIGDNLPGQTIGCVNTVERKFFVSLCSASFIYFSCIQFEEIYLIGVGCIRMVLCCVYI